MTDRDAFFHYVMAWIGRPYSWGGDDHTGWDCSGFAIETLTAAGVWRPGQDATAQGLYDHFQSRGRLGLGGLGALHFFGRDLASISHVAIGVSPRFLVEAGGGGRNTLTPEDAKRQNAFVRMRPVNHRSDLVATIMPTYKFLEG